jgi:hypothetical protein
VAISALRELVRIGVAVDKLARSEFAKIRSRQEALQTIFPSPGHFPSPDLGLFSEKATFSTATGFLDTHFQLGPSYGLKF